MANDYVDVCAVDDLPAEQVKLFHVGARRVALVSAGGEVRAFAHRCPHRGGPLGLGRLACQLEADGVGKPVTRSDEWVLICPWHAWEFSLSDGTVVADHSVRARMYDTRVSDGRVLVSFSRPVAPSPSEERIQ
jgi:nitrite reductase/ring-hydroxylating ferredoxin subunit